MTGYEKVVHCSECRKIMTYDCPMCGFNEEGYCTGGPDNDQYCSFGAYKASSRKAIPDRPEIVCLCGSTRFFKTFDEANFRLTLEGKIVLSIGCNTKSDEGLKLTSEDKARLDELHKRKIDLCDSILVLNVGGYIGDSTRSEIEYAGRIGKPVKYLE